MSREKIIENEDELRLIEDINSALREMEQKEMAKYEKLKTPVYRRPAYHWWWVFAPLGLIMLFFIALSLLPPQIPSLSKIDNQIFQVEQTISYLEPINKTIPGDKIDEQLLQMENEIKQLQEEKNG